jgi:hypothetical protein
VTSYTTGLLIGRAFALANVSSMPEDHAVRELAGLAAHEPAALHAARLRFQELVGRRSGSIEDRRALRLIERAVLELATFEVAAIG